MKPGDRQVPHYGIQNVSHNWDDPHTFNPDRFLSPGVEYAQKLLLGREWYEGLDFDPSLALDGSNEDDSADTGAFMDAFRI